MRILVFVMIMLLSACASNAPGNLQGNSGKAGQAVAYKHIDADPNYVLPDGYQCRSGSVLACTVKQGRSDCACQMISDLEDRTTRMISGGERGAIRRSRGFRQ